MGIPIPVPRGSIYNTIMELGPPKTIIGMVLSVPNSIMTVYMDPLGLQALQVLMLKPSNPGPKKLPMPRSNHYAPVLKRSTQPHSVTPMQPITQQTYQKNKVQQQLRKAVKKNQRVFGLSSSWGAHDGGADQGLGFGVSGVPLWWLFGVWSYGLRLEI